MPRTMLAAVFEGGGRLEFRQRSVPQVQRDDDVILQVGGVGICGTDLHILDMPPRHPAKRGIVLGHEFAGRVVEVGSSVAQLRLGDHVIVDQNAPCGECDMCRAGLPNACSTLFTAEVPGFPNTFGIFQDGAMAEFVRIPAKNVYPIASHVPMSLAALAEPLACVVNGTTKINIQPGESAVVLGAGPIGLLFVAMLKAGGASRIIVSETSPLRRRAATKCGADIVVDPAEQDIREVVRAQTKGRGADAVVEAVGPLFNLCIELVRMGGRVLLFGHDESAKPGIPPAEIVRNEITVFGTYLAKYTFIPAIKILEGGQLPLTEVVTHTMPLEKVHEGIALLRRGEAIKVILTPAVF